jgi:CopG family nickel-responsive transcriptional regulator
MARHKKEVSTRITVSIPPELLSQFDELVSRTAHGNRSMEITNLIQNRLLEDAATREKGQVMGTLTLMFDHHKHHLQETLTSVQHDHQANIISTLHVHIDHDNCLEVLILRGKGPEIEALAGKLMSVKGIKVGKLMITATVN